MSFIRMMDKSSEWIGGSWSGRVRYFAPSISAPQALSDESGKPPPQHLAISPTVHFTHGVCSAGATRRYFFFFFSSCSLAFRLAAADALPALAALFWLSVISSQLLRSVFLICLLLHLSEESVCVHPADYYTAWSFRRIHENLSVL